MNWICVTCGVEFEASEQAPETCLICEDPRQYVGLHGQKWTTLDEMEGRWKNKISALQPDVHSVHSEPHFGIGQRAYLLQTDEGNLLFDCVTLLDDETISAFHALGGIQAIAISHPHYYATMVEWSRAFGDVPIYLHERDKEWVVRSTDALQFWQGETKSLFGGVELVRCGGHFDGYQVAHWKDLLFAGDQPQVAMDQRWLSFLYSYPNMIPLHPSAVREIVRALSPYNYDRLYGAFGRAVHKDAKAAVERSAKRYLQAIGLS